MNITGVKEKTAGEGPICFSDAQERDEAAQIIRDAKDGSAVTGAKNHEKIKDVSETDVSLNKAEEPTDAFGSRIKNVKLQAERHSMSGFLEEDKEMKASAARTAAARECLAKVGERLSGRDCQELDKEGTDLSECSSEQLEKAVERIKQQRSDKRDALDRQIDRNKEYRSQIEDISMSGVQKQAADRLEQSGLPVTKENIERFTTALGMADTAGNMTDQSYTYLLGNQKEPTIQNVYHAGIIGSAKPQETGSTAVQQVVDPSKDADWEKVRIQASGIVQAAGFKEGSKESAEAVEAAKWLFDHDLPITQENLYGLANLKEVQAAAGTEEFRDSVLAKMADTVAAGREAVDTRLGAVYEQIAESAVKKFAELDFGDLASVTAHRQLEEVRLKMTVEAGVKLLEKGIPLDTENLSKIVDGLKELEQEYAKSLLEQEGTQASPENIALFREIAGKAEAFAQMPTYPIKQLYETEETVSFQELYSEGLALKNRLEQAGESYDTMRTQVRQDLGDSMSKAFGNIDSLLQEMGFDTSDANRRAVRILAYNHMEIDGESVNRMKYYDNRVNRLLENMKPAVVARMIQEEDNPLEMPFKELEQKVQEYADTAAGAEEEYAKFLWKMDRQGGMSQEERTSYIGIYRLLHQIQKSDGAAVGAVVGAGQEMNLKNLLTAVRTAKSGGIKADISDDFGGMEQAAFSGERISDQIAAAFGNISFEKLQERIRQQEAGTEELYQEARAEEVRDVIMDSDAAVRFLNSFDITDSIAHIEAAKEMLTGKNRLGRFLDQAGDKDELEETSDAVLEEFEGEEEAKEAYGRLEAFMQQRIDAEKARPRLSAEEFAQLRQVSHTVALAGSLSRRECYEIPMVADGQVTRLNVTLEHGGDETGKIDITIELPELGKVKAGIILNKESVKGHFICSGREGLDRLEQDRNTLSDLLHEQTGREVKQLSYTMEGSRMEAYRGRAGSDRGNTWKNLYQTAKAVVNYIRNIERVDGENED